MNRSLVKTLVLASLSLTHGLAFAVVYDIVGPGMDFGTAVATNASGETFIAGHFQGGVDFSTTISLTGTGATDGYLAMVDRNIVWAVAVGGNGGAAVNINDVAALSDGSVVVVGQFTDNLIAGGLIATGALDAFVARFDSVGNAIWATQIGGSGGESAFGVTVDSADNIFVTGNFYESVLGTTIESANMGTNAVINSSGSYDGFLAAYNVDGQLLWYDTINNRSDLMLKGCRRAQPLSASLPNGLRFLTHPLPDAPGACLAARCPQPGERRFRANTRTAI